MDNGQWTMTMDNGQWTMPTSGPTFDTLTPCISNYYPNVGQFPQKNGVSLVNQQHK